MPAQPEGQPEPQAPETRLPVTAGGRDPQLAALNAAWKRARRGEATLALVLAPAGLGKSWLTRSWVRSQQEHAQRPPASSAQTSRARTSQARTPGLSEAALWTVTAGPLLPGLLRAGLLTLRHERDPAFLAAATSLLPSPLWPVLAQTAALPADRGALWLTLWRVLERTALRLGGLCLLIEDLHACFPDDLEALRSLWARLQVSRTPILLLLTSRPEGGEEFWASLRPGEQHPEASPPSGETADADPALRRLHLGRLERGGLEAMTAALLGSASFPSALVAWLHARCEGHPLHATELLRFLMAGDLLRDPGTYSSGGSLGASSSVAAWQFQPPPDSAIPHGLEAVLTARLVSARQEDGPAVPRARLCASLWPDADEQAAEQNFRTTLRRLRESLGDVAQIVRDAQGRYLLGQPRADVFMFLEAQARLDLEGAYGWYGGEFLPGLDLTEAEPLAAMLRGRWRDLTLRLLGERGAAGGEALYRRLVADDPCDLEAVLVFVQGLTQAGQGGQATAVLSRAAARFQAELGEVPPALVLAQQAGRQDTVPLASPRS